MFGVQQHNAPGHVLCCMCGVGMPPNPAGMCVACVDGAPCTTANPCEAGTLDCSSGAPVCQPAGPATAGTLCRGSAGICDVEERCRRAF